MKIYLNESAFDRITAVKEMVEDLTLFDVDFSCMEYTILKSDFDCCYVENCDEIKGCFVLDQISKILEMDTFYDVLCKNSSDTLAILSCGAWWDLDAFAREYHIDFDGLFATVNSNCTKIFAYNYDESKEETHEIGHGKWVGHEFILNEDE